MAKKKASKSGDEFKKKLQNHKEISRVAPDTAFEGYSANSIRKEIGKKPKNLGKPKSMPKAGPYKQGKGVDIKNKK